MTRVARHLRMTEADKARKLEAQRRRRLAKPSVNGRIRKVLGTDDYLETYEQLLKEQKGKCGICGIVGGDKRFHMDHDHKTQEIRGLLCFSCNSKLGFVEKYLGQIVRYLKW